MIKLTILIKNGKIGTMYEDNSVTLVESSLFVRELNKLLLEQMEKDFGEQHDLLDDEEENED